MPSLSRTSAGLLYQADHSSLAGWTGDASWQAQALPAFVAFDPAPMALFVPANRGEPDYDGVREGQLFVDSDGSWWLLYDAGDGSTGWRMFLAKSLDRGRTWLREGAVIGLSNGAAGNYSAVATGWIEKRGGTYYLHRVTANATFAAPNIGLPAGPYLWDVWKASSILGPYTFVRSQSLEASTIASSEKLPGCIVLNGATYLGFCECNTGSGYTVGMATATAPDGVYSVGASGAIVSNATAGFGSRWPENPKVFFSATLNRWVMLVNLIATDGLHTDASAMLVNASGNGPDVWTGAAVHIFQLVSAMDGALALGVPSHITQPEGALFQSSDGYVPIAFDALPQRDTPGWHRGRRILHAVLEPSANAYVMSAGNASDLIITRALAHTDSVAEFAVRFPSGGTVGLWLRANGAGNGYRIAVPSGGKLFWQRMAGGTAASTSIGTGNQSADANAFNRVRIELIGTSLKAYLNGEKQLDLTDATYASGTNISLDAQNALNAQVRCLHLRASNSLVVNGCQPGSEVLVRAKGGLPLTASVANASGIATITHTHWPAESLDVGGVVYTLGTPSSLWGGDALQFSGMPASVLPGSERAVLGL